ncbi:MAG: ACP S-malonyltransferase [Candidatus Gastranaerophilales bacterium]|nr:ACP S-malonyltransferase [Candidatus Gastranaerophilales bacterium]
MTKTALIFTGQGSQVSGMGKDFYEKYEVSKKVFETFNNVLSKNISELCFNGSEEDLKQTINSQPCILATEIAILEAVKSELNINVNFVAGHSLGEYAALYEAGVVDLESAITLINARAAAMNKVNTGKMSAIIGISDENLSKVIAEAGKIGYVDIANYNTPVQTVITGEDEAILKANELALQYGAKKAILLAVSGAFHSKMMKDASEEFKLTVDKTNLSDAKIPVITNVDAEPTIKKEDFREKMPKQIYSSVHWVQTLNYLKEQGVDNFIEIGPSKILTGMVKKTLTDVQFGGISTVEDLEKYLALAV